MRQAVMAHLLVTMPDKTEIITALVKGAASGLPFVGGVISEVGSLFIDPVEKRKVKWRETIEEVLTDLNEKCNRKPEEIASDETFISALFIATPTAYKYHQKEKIIALKSALFNIGKSSGDEFEKSQQYLRYIDELSVMHFKTLLALENHAGQLSKVDKLESIYAKVIQINGLVIERILFRSIIQDLNSRFLIQIGDVEEYPEFATKYEFLTTEKSGIRHLKVTKLGREFLKLLVNMSHNKRFVRTRLGFGVCKGRLHQWVNPLT